MAYKLVIVESPAKARTIGRFLGKTFRVEASNGHVRDLPKSQLGVDVDNNFEPKYITIRGRGEILDKIRKDARGASKILLATDPDREGEAISWHLANVLGINPGDACRVEFHEITGKAVAAAMKDARPINMRLVDAQQARRVLDRLVGYKISPLLWAKVKRGLSAGRVQSVATRMICDREREIDEFEQVEYWTIAAMFDCEGVNLQARLAALGGQKADIDSVEQAEAALARIRAGCDYALRSVKWGERRKHPAAPFTTSNMQQEASRKLGFTAQKTMQIAQQLYEGIDIEGEGTQGLISYIRTDSTRVSDEAITSVREMILERYGEVYLPESPNVYKSRKSAQDAHEAIRPTEIYRRPEAVKSSLTRDQMRLYKLVYDRFVSSQMTSALYDTLSAEISDQERDCLFQFSGMRKRFAGFTVVYEESRDDESEDVESLLPDLKEGTPVAIGEPEAAQHFTEPPPRYTEAALVRALEEQGIGRPSTYAPTISTILGRGYIVRESKRLFPTELGLIVTDMMKRHFADIVDIEFTAGMELRLDEVEERGANWREVISDFYGPFETTLAEAERVIEKVEVVDEVSDVVCDKCGAMMVYKMGRFGKFLACPRFPECRNTKAILKEIEAPCPKCGAKLLERISRRGRKFYGCQKYPDCDFTSWDMPVTGACPECGGMMVCKHNRKGEAWNLCVNQTCRHRIDVTGAEGED